MPANAVFLAFPCHVRGKVARERGEVGPTRGITVKAAPRAAAAAVMPGVRRTPGPPRGREARGSARVLLRQQGLPHIKIFFAARPNRWWAAQRVQYRRARVLYIIQYCIMYFICMMYYSSLARAPPHQLFPYNL